MKVGRNGADPDSDSDDDDGKKLGIVIGLPRWQPGLCNETWVGAPLISYQCLTASVCKLPFPTIVNFKNTSSLVD